MFSEWESFVLLGMGAVGFLVGALFRAGYMRRWATAYLNPSFPPHVRNGIFAMMPFGAVFLLWWVGIAIYESGGSPVAATLPFLASVPALVIGLIFSVRPPVWMKPAWLRADERDPAAASRARARNVRMTRVQYLLSWIAVAAAVVVWWLLDLGVAALVVGLAFTIPIILAARPRTSARPETTEPP